MKRKNVFVKQLEGLLFGNDWNSCQQAPKLILNSDTGYYFNQEILGLIPDEQANGRLKGPRRLKTAIKTYKEAIADAKKELIEAINRTFPYDADMEDDYVIAVITEVSCHYNDPVLQSIQFGKKLTF